MTRSNLAARAEVSGPRRLSTRRARSQRVLVTVEPSTGGSALVRGDLLAIRPNGSLLGLPTSVLVDGPFNGWRLPGLLLGGLVGVGYLAAGTVEHGRYRHSAQISAVAGAGLVCFEAVEWRWLGFHPCRRSSWESAPPSSRSPSRRRRRRESAYRQGWTCIGSRWARAGTQSGRTDVSTRQLSALLERRARADLYHSALQVTLPRTRG